MKTTMLPPGWREVVLDNVARRGSGHTPNKKRATYWDGEIRWISLRDLDRLDRVFIADTHSHVSEDGLRHSSAVLHPAGTVVVSRDATVGKVGIMSIPMAVSQHFIAWQCGPELFNQYLYYWLQKNRSQMERIAVGSTIKTVGLPFFKALRIVLPPLAEQKRIVSTLRDSDRLSVHLEDLVAAKKALRRGLLQQLSPQQASKFVSTKQWSEYRLGELFSERVEVGRTDLRLLSITAERGVVPRETLERRDTSNVDKTRYLRIAPGDIGYNTMRMWQGVSGLATLEGIVSPAYTVVVPGQNVDGRYAATFFRSPWAINQFRRSSQGLVADTLNLKFHHFSQIRMPFPPINEQRAIGELFAALDKEIELLQRLFNTIARQKSVLLQKLLSGELVGEG